MGLRPTPTAHHTDEKRAAELHVRISQDTFDSAVQENIDEFGMEPDEAVADAKQQFESQGVNLSNVLLRAPGAPAEDDPPAVQAVRRLEALMEEAEEEETLELVYGQGRMKINFLRFAGASAPAVALSEAAAALRAECAKDKGGASVAGHHGAVDALVSSALALYRMPAALPPVLEALALVLMDAENRERLGVRGLAVVVALIRDHDGVAAVQRGALLAARAAMLVHESNRQQLVTSAGILKLAAKALADYADGDAATFLAACSVVRASTLADDARARASKGIEHAKAAVELGVLPRLLAAARGPMAKAPAQLAELLATLSRLAVTDTICSKLAGMDALSLAISELANHMTEAAVAKQACFFLASISGNDGCKDSIVRNSGHVAIIQAMLLHPTNAALQIDAVAALGNMCLRMPQNCAAVAEAGGLGAVVTAFATHIGHPRMQSKGCLAVRNLVGRNEELRQPLIDLDVETPLRATMAAHADGPTHNQAKAALRDLHLSVHMEEAWQGMVGESKTLEQGEADGENHWDKFLDNPVAQEAIKRELDAMGISPE